MPYSIVNHLNKLFLIKITCRVSQILQCETQMRDGLENKRVGGGETEEFFFEYLGGQGLPR